MRNKTRLSKVAAALLLTWACAGSAAAQKTDARFDVVCVANRDASDITKRKACLDTVPVLRFGSEVTLAVEHAPEVDFDDAAQADPSRLVLFLEGKALSGTRARVGQSQLADDGVTTTLLTFRVVRDLTTETARKNWKEVIVAAKSRKILSASCGLENGTPAASRAEVEFEVIARGKLVVGFFLAALLALVFFLVAVRTGLLRDFEPPSEEVKQPTDRAYSLARVQMAVWTVVILFSFLYVWYLTREYNGLIPPSALVLMGITAGTFATAAGVDSQKLKANRETLRQKQVKLAQAPADVALAEEVTTLRDQTRVCTSEGFFRDIITSGEGPSLHRLQFIVWTMALLVVFIAGAWETLSLPEFDDTLLGLMGISSGAYVGLKLPESKA